MAVVAVATNMIPQFRSLSGTSLSCTGVNLLSVERRFAVAHLDASESMADALST